MIQGNVQEAANRKKGSALLYVLVFTFALFIGILITVYVITRQSRPVMLDEHGKPVSSSCIDSPGREGVAIPA